MFERPKPFQDQVWEMSKAGYIESLYSKGPLLPTSVADILDCADIDAEVEDVDEMDIDWEGITDDENYGYQ